MENLVYHYTSLEAMKGIIGTDLCLWATRYDHLNDPHEQIWADEMVSVYCEKHYVSKDYTLNDLKTMVAKYSYILSLCEIPDYRNMWRLYCNDGLGICIGLDADELSRISCENSYRDPKHHYEVFESVLYSSKKDIVNAVNYWKQEETFNRNPDEPEEELMSMRAFIKDEDFDIEHEIRYACIRENEKVVMSPSDGNNMVYIKAYEDTKEVKYRRRGEEEIVPYLELHFPCNIIKSIIVGYQYEFEKAKAIIENHLRLYSDSYNHVKIIKSSLY